MSQAAASHAAAHAVEPTESPLTPESWGKLGMWIFLAGDAVGFGVLLAAYGASFAKSWGRKARELLAEHGAELFGVRVRSDVRSASEWGLWGREGGMVSSGVGGPMTGRLVADLVAGRPPAIDPTPFRASRF